MKKLMNLVLMFIFIIILFGCSGNSSVLVTAHRGASGTAPENTLSAMVEAINMGAEFSELDVQETADGEIILLHDKTLTRTAGIEKNIWEVNYSDLKNLEVGSWYKDKFKGEPIPKLSDVIQLVKGKMKLNIELKTNGHEKKLADRVVEIVAEQNYSDDCIFTSFDFSQVDRIKEINPTLKVGYIFGKLPTDVDVFKANVDLLSVHYRVVDNDFMKKSIENNKEVHVWTVNDVDEMKRIANLGVTSIITNYPDRLRKVLLDLEN